MRDIDVVIIGINSEKTIGNCIESVLASDYDKNKLHIYYADGGSIDTTKDIVKGYKEVSLVELYPKNPTPGFQRNEGWKKGKSEFVMFIDSDTQLHKKWLSIAVEAFKDNIAAVCGNRLEKHPEKSLFNWIGNLEWNGKHGKIDEFGGDVMIRRNILEESGGYNNSLVAGEDPELSIRICKAGHAIIRIDSEMTRHDLAMYTLKQYWKRAYRTGYAYVEVYLMHKNIWKEDIKRIIIRGMAICMALIFPFIIIFSGIYSLLLIEVGLIYIGLRPRIKLVDYFKTRYNIKPKEATLYSWHATLVVIPQLMGIIRYIIGKIINKPLLNKSKLLATGGVK